jgi:hypothetical protein
MILLNGRFIISGVEPLDIATSVRHALNLHLQHSNRVVVQTLITIPVTVKVVVILLTPQQTASTTG